MVRPLILFDLDGTLLRAGDRAHQRALVEAVRDVLGLDPLSDKWTSSSIVDSKAAAALAALVEDQLEARQKARAERDFAAADAIRDRLLAAGITVEDTPDGPQWTFKDS